MKNYRQRHTHTVGGSLKLKEVEIKDILRCDLYRARNFFPNNVHLVKYSLKCYLNTYNFYEESEKIKLT